MDVEYTHSGIFTIAPTSLVRENDTNLQINAQGASDKDKIGNFDGKLDSFSRIQSNKGDFCEIELLFNIRVEFFESIQV